MNNKLLINRNFAFLWMGKIISQIGDKFYGIALAWWILQKTNSPGIMGFFLLVSVLPGLVFGFFAGTLVDRLNRKNVLIITDILRGILVMAIVLLSLFRILHVWHVFFIAAILSLTAAFFDPAAQAIIPQLVESDDIKRANSMNQTITGLCTVLGPVLGASSVSFFGMTAVFLINSISYFISAMCEKMVYYKASAISSNNTVFKDMKEGILFLKKNRDIIRIIYIIAAVHFFLGCLMVSLPFLSNSLDGNGIQNLGSLEALLGIGLLVGALYIGRQKNIQMKESSLISLILFVGLCFMLISVLQFASLQNILPYAVSYMMIGFGISSASVFWQSLIQLKAPGYMTGRVFSVSTLAGNISLPIAYGIFGILLDLLPISILMLFCGCCLILLSVFLQIIIKITAVK